MADKFITVTKLLIKYNYKAWIMKHYTEEIQLKLANI